MIPRRGAGALACVLIALGTSGCGKKGPPLPPLVRLPAAPADVKADRRGDAVDVALTLPAANTDGSRPANVERVDIYALTGEGTLTDSEVVKAGTRVGTVSVKAPRDPDETVDADEPDSDLEPLQGPGLDQGAVAHVRELLTEAIRAGGTTRTYVGVGISTKGRRGPLSKAVPVALAAAPPAPAQPAIAYDEHAVTVTWPAVAAATAEETVAYNVYDVSPTPAGAPPPNRGENRLTATATDVATYVDERIAWNVERCYIVRAVRLVGALSVEGDASPQRCEVLKDTFPPAPPTGLTTVASEGTISLIWTPSPEADLAGYRVLRASEPTGTLLPVTSGLISETTFTDRVAAGVTYAYAVQAVDTAGNVSEPSARVEETAR